MKKLFGICFIYCLTLALILVSFGFCYGEKVTGNFGIGYKYDTKSDLESMNVKLNADIALEKNISVIIRHQFAKEQNEDTLIDLSMQSKIQANYYTTSSRYYFAGIEYKRDIQEGIEDRTDTGFGIGGKLGDPNGANFSFQTGLYLTSEYYGVAIPFERSFSNKTYGFGTIPITGILSGEVNAGLDANLDNLDNEDYIFTGYGGIKAQFSDNMSGSIGIDYTHIHRPIIGTRDSKIWLAMVNYDF